MASDKNCITIRDGDIVNVGGTRFLVKKRKGESAMDFIEIPDESKISKAVKESLKNGQ